MVAPFEYTALAGAWGLIGCFGRQCQAPYTLLGVAIIIGSGLYRVRQERTPPSSA